MKFNKTQQYRLDHHLCIDCGVLLYASEYNSGITRCKTCIAKFQGKQPPEEPKAPDSSIKVRMNRLRFNLQADRCLHCPWVSYPGNSTLFCLSPVCMRDHK